MSVVLHGLAEHVSRRPLNLQTNQIDEDIQHGLNVFQIERQLRVDVDGHVLQVGKQGRQIDQETIETILSVDLHAIHFESVNAREIRRVDRRTLEEILQQEMSSDCQRVQLWSDFEE